MKRKPLKTLVIVDTASISQWVDYKCYYGRRKEDGSLVVTTKNTFMRPWKSLTRSAARVRALPVCRSVLPSAQRADPSFAGRSATPTI